MRNFSNSSILNQKFAGLDSVNEESSELKMSKSHSESIASLKGLSVKSSKTGRKRKKSKPKPQEEAFKFSDDEDENDSSA